MKKTKFYSAVYCPKKEKNGKFQRNGYLLETENNKFGLFKNDFGDFDIIDIDTGLSINFLHYYKLKDFKNDIKKFDDKLNDFKEKNKENYKQLIELFANYEIFEEVH